MLRLSIIFKEETPMKNNDINNDFISLTAAVRRAKSEGLNLSYAGLRRFVAEGFIPHVPNGSHILVYYPNVANLIKNGVTAEQSRAYQLSRSRS